MAYYNLDFNQLLKNIPFFFFSQLFFTNHSYIVSLKRVIIYSFLNTLKTLQLIIITLYTELYISVFRDPGNLTR